MSGFKLPVKDGANGIKLGQTKSVRLVLYVGSVSCEQCTDAAVNASSLDGSASTSKLHVYKASMSAVDCRLSNRTNISLISTCDMCLYGVRAEIQQQREAMLISQLELVRQT